MRNSKSTSNEQSRTASKSLTAANKLSFRQWFRDGNPWVWLTGGAVAVSVIMTIGLIGLIAYRGLEHFWPAAVIQAQYTVPGQATETLAGEVTNKEEVPRQRLADAGLPVAKDGPEVMTRHLLKVGNREVYPADFTWLVNDWLTNITRPKDIMTIERRSNGNFYGYLEDVRENGKVVATGDQAWGELLKRAKRANALEKKIDHLQRVEIGKLNYSLDRVRLHGRALELKGKLDDAAKQKLEARRNELNTQIQGLEQQLSDLTVKYNRDQFKVRTADGKEEVLQVGTIVRAYHPNALSAGAKAHIYMSRLWEFLSAQPREANTEGGVFPAIFGTVIMTLIMAVLVTPFGVIAAVYMREYAKQGFVTKLIRIAVNNLAGVPSIVYGVFGLGFFVYVLGGSIDKIFFPESLPGPTFGTPGLLWASLTLAILAVPVGIVSTEEGLTRIPRSLREGSLALGATKAETLWKVVLPMASPAMMTGLILAVARAAGEVAPLMLVGVVKLAPTLPINGSYPYLHLDQKIMHLGFHIYDVGFQSPNVEAARPLVYATALLLILIVALLNISAVLIRNNLREKYKMLDG